jgi:hypothetical protein
MSHCGSFTVRGHHPHFPQRAECSREGMNSRRGNPVIVGDQDPDARHRHSFCMNMIVNGRNEPLSQGWREEIEKVHGNVKINWNPA